MRVILTSDVARLGAEGEVVEVARGYARNYLFPRGLAVEASRGALRDLERRRASLESKREHARKAAQEMLERIHAHPITVRRKASEEGRLHGSITSQHLAELVEDEIGVRLDRRQIELHEPIRHTGSYLITVRPHPDVSGELALNVVSDSASQAGEAGETQEQQPARQSAEPEGSEESEESTQPGETEESQ